MYLKENIRYLRRKNDMSQDDLADLIGYKSFTTIQKWESGRSEPPFSVVVKLSQIFGVDIDRLVNVDLSSPDKALDGIDNFDDQIHTIAAHAERPLTEEEIDEVMEYAKYIIAKHNKKK